MKYLLLICLLFFGCKNPFEPERKEASFTITDKMQVYYESLDEYGLLEIHYKVKNTGNVDIDYYKVWFKVTCKDGSTYKSWDNGLSIDVGKELSDNTYINTADKQYSKVEITDYELTTY